MKYKPASAKELGLKCGIEIHQQLNTGKLFCRCPILNSEDTEFKEMRKLRSLAGETGKIDAAALMEKQRDRTFIYEGSNQYCCEVELDEEPPSEMNAEALSVVLQVAKMLKAKIVDEIFVMRKTVVDGSNTSGFQRTGLVAIDGEIKTSKGKVRIANICIEEEACRIIKQESKKATYRLDRLGIPLIEIGTEPDIVDQNHAKEVAEKLGMLIRATGKACRGIGTIRQDINVSIKKGKRVEIKGAQDLKMIPRIVEIEAIRQKELVEIAQKLERKKITEAEGTQVDLSKVFERTDSKLIKKGLANGGVIKGILLKGFKGILGQEIQPEKRFGTELSEHAKVFASVGGIFHSDELPNYGITDTELKEVRSKLGAEEEDAFVLVCAEQEKAKKALNAVIKRANLAIKGNVSEVRKANQDGTSTFMRWMPGAARMYPETDLDPITPDIESIELPELIEEKEKRYKGMGVAADTAKELAKSENAEQFEQYSKEYQQAGAAYVAQLLIEIPKEIKKRLSLDVEKLESKDYEKILKAVDTGKISKDATIEILSERIKGTSIEKAITKYALLTGKELESEIQEIVKTAKDAPIRAVMGMVMKELRGKADGKEIAEIVKRLIK